MIFDSFDNDILILQIYILIIFGNIFMHFLNLMDILISGGFYYDNSKKILNLGGIFLKNDNSCQIYNFMYLLIME